MASTSKEKEVSSLPKEDGSQHDDATQEDPESYKAVKDWDIDFILQKLRHTECSLLLERTFDSNTLLHVAASLGHDQIVEAILSIEQHQELLTAKNSSGDIPLHVAANAGHLSIVQHLVNPSRPYSQELLMTQNSNGDLPLHVAANAGHLPIVVQFLGRPCRKHQELLKAQNSNGDLPLHVAANAGHLPIVQYLVESSKPYEELLMSLNSHDDVPLHVAANAGDQSIDQQLVEPSDPNEKYLIAKKLAESYKLKRLILPISKLQREINEEGNTPLHLALIKKYEEVDENLKSKYNEVAEFLIKKDPGVCYCENKAGMNPQDMAEEAEDADLSKLISDLAPPKMVLRTAYVDAEMEDQRIRKCKRQKTLRGDRRNRKSKDKVTSMKGELYEAVKLQNITHIQKLIEQDLEHSAVSLSDKTPELNTILHVAAASSDDNHQFVQEILKLQLCQEFVTKKKSNGDLPLHVAASAGNMKIVELLVKWSSEQLKDHCNCVPLEEKNMEENTPLHLALKKKFQLGRNSALKAKYNKVAKFLVEKCPKVSYYPNKERKSPLYMAAEAGDAELVKLMINTVPLQYGKSIVHAAIYYLLTISNLPYGKSIVHAAIYGSFTVRKLRCLNAYAASFLCPSMCLNTHTDILDTILKCLPDDILTVKDDEGMTPLFYAASIGYLEGVEILLKKPTKCGAYDMRDKDGYYPIHIASRKGHIQVIKKFLDKYPDMIELLNEEGQNILHVAALYGKAKVVVHMLKRHDLKVEMLINNEDENGNTPLHLAASEGHPKVVWHLTWDERVDLKALNKEGKRALDIALNDSGENPSFGEQLTWEALRYVSGPRAPRQRISGEDKECSKVGKTLSTDKYTDRTDTLLLVATLVATVAFAAAFTMPGGYNGPGGVATFLEKLMFQVFVVSNTIAMYSAITAVIALIWARLGDLKLLIAAYKFSLPFLGLAITMVSLAFMVGNYLVLRDLSWLAYLVLSIGSFSLFTLSIIFFPLILPNSSHHRIFRYLLRYPFYLLIIFTRCDTDDEDEE